MKKFVITKKIKSFDENTIIGAECYDEQALIIALMTAFTNDLRTAVNTAHWAKEANIGDKYENINFTIEVCKVGNYD